MARRAQGDVTHPNRLGVRRQQFGPEGLFGRRLPPAEPLADIDAPRDRMPAELR